MGFNRRYLSEDSIRKAASSSLSSFDTFEKHMTTSEVYIIQGENTKWTSEVFHKFKESNRTNRLQIYHSIQKGEI
jgi:hypothetical protein